MYADVAVCLPLVRTFVYKLSEPVEAGCPHLWPGVLAHLAYRSLPAALVIAGLEGFLATACTLVLMQVAVGATPRAGAAMGFALLMSAWNIGDALGDVIAATLIERAAFDFYGVIGVYGTAMAALLLALPLLPRALLSHQERAAGAAA